MQLLKILLEVVFMAACVGCASCQRCIDVMRESIFEIAVIATITAVGVKLVEWVTGQ